LNIVGFEIYIKSELKTTISYHIGVITIEFWIIYFTLLFDNHLIINKKFIRFIGGYLVFFICILAYIFYASSKSETSKTTAFGNYTNYPFWFGLILSGTNFIQIPFWTIWNLYLLNGKYIEISKTRKYFYVLGTISGKFIGMLTLIFSLSYFTNQTNFLTKHLMKEIIPAVFAALGIYQGIKFYRKYIV